MHPGDYRTVAASRYPFANILPQGKRGEDWVHTAQYVEDVELEFPGEAESSKVVGP